MTRARCAASNSRFISLEHGQPLATVDGQISPGAVSDAIIQGVTAVERAMDRATRRAEQVLGEIGREIRAARLTHGISQAALGQVVGIAQSEVSRIERGKRAAVPLALLIKLCAGVGLDLSSRVFPGGTPLRDAAHLELLARLRAAISPEWRWQAEVPLPIAGDKRAWDGVLRMPTASIGVEAETRPRDIQELERRVALKRRDGGLDRVVLLLRDSSWNRRLVRSNASSLEQSFPVPGKVALRALAQAREPGGDTIILL